MGANLSATYATEQMSLRYDGSTAQSDNYKAARDFKAAGPAAANKPTQWLGGNEVGRPATRPATIRWPMHCAATNTWSRCAWACRTSPTRTIPTSAWT